MSETPGSRQVGTDGKFSRASIWLSLSGGGLRAAIFHYGCLKRLHEVGLLPHVYAISATSGGAIVAALLACHWSGGDPEIDDERDVFLHAPDWENFERKFLTVVRRGVFAPTAMLVSAYVCYAAGAVIGLISRVAALCIIAAGLLLHLALAIQLLRDRAHQPSENAERRAMLDRNYARAEWAHRSMRRFLRMLLSPSYLRLHTLNLRAFKGELLRAVLRPKLYLTAVDLNSGKEFVFTNEALADLNAAGCHSLWKQKATQTDEKVPDIEVALVVSASSAFPPIFRPVPVETRSRLRRVLVDGGVFDNFALHVPKALSIHIHPARPGQGYGPRGNPSFRETTSFILGCDGGKGPVTKKKRSWGRLRAMLRLPAILVDQQFDATLQTALEFERIGGINTWFVGLGAGFPRGSALDDPQLVRHLGQIRTHLDAFTNEECAVIAYCGYLWTEELFKATPQLREQYANVAWVPPRELADILPEWCGDWKQSLPELRRHLRYSKWRLGIVRLIGRCFG